MITTAATDLSDVLIIEPKVFGDERGFFYESFNKSDFQQATGVTEDFVQDNHSRSTRGVLRGLHYQVNCPQGKLVRVCSGEVYDVVVDIRKSSADYGKWIGVHLSSENNRQIWIPQGFAHGFIVTSEIADFLYKTTDYYSPENERCIRWDDPELNIDWQFSSEPVVSEKDSMGKLFVDAELFE